MDYEHAFGSHETQEELRRITYELHKKKPEKQKPQRKSSRRLDLLLSSPCEPVEEREYCS